MEFRLWTVLHGWQKFDKARPQDEPTEDNIAEPLAALKAITGMGGGDPFGARGIFVMMHPHKMLSQHLGMIQCVKEYAKTFVAGHRRLIILTPLSYSLPEELQDDVVILDYDPPSYAELRDVYDRLINDVPEARRPKYNDAQIDQILANGAGMTQAEFDNAISRALVTNRAKLPNIPLDDFCKMIADVKTEVVKRSEVLEIMEPIEMSAVGGLDNLKDWVQKRAGCFSQKARDFGVEPPKGIALIGPPGTGKSLASKAIASVLGIPLLKLEVGRLFQSLVGQSEQRVRDALRMVDSMAPCVLMIDEIDNSNDERL
ncbi:AAA family ATPase [Mesorhizobium sp.]|uniref:AAA family ATPase n=1 Tax=Mesorhizobium sp. TaxID=1871066 RepID=UPI000FE7E611|nr:AAA family ATPase [Mesorhizobium sp.]RWP30694.1 MAG: AAA family ATPase [Mesorhizobium sp.]